MKSIIISLLLTSFLFAQETKKKDQKTPHLAILTVKAWANDFSKGSVEKKHSIITEVESKLLNKGGHKPSFEQELSNSFLNKENILHFETNPTNEKLGKLFLNDYEVFPMKFENDQWTMDVISMHKAVASNQIRTFSIGLYQYLHVVGRYPTDKQGLRSLIKKPTTAPIPRRWVQMIGSLDDLNDPWGNPYQYKLVDKEPVITSLGPDGKESKDDISAKQQELHTPSPKGAN